MQAKIYERGTNGVLSSSVLKDISSFVTDGSFSQGAWWGDLDANLSLSLNSYDALVAAKNWLGCGLAIASDRGDIVWEGHIWAIQFGSGTRVRKRSLAGYANRVKIVYNKTNFTTTPPKDEGFASVVVDNTTEQAIYGIVEIVLQGGQLTTTQATNKANKELADRIRILYEPVESSVSPSANVQIQALGWWNTLNYRVYSDTNSGTQELATQIQAVLATCGGFLSSDFSNFATTGTSVAKFEDQNRNGIEVIRALTAQANGYLFRVGRSRICSLIADGKSATTPEFIEDSAGIIRSLYGEQMTAFDLRAGAILRQLDFSSDSSVATASALDPIADVYLEEIEWQWDGTVSYRASNPKARGGS